MSWPILLVHIGDRAGILVATSGTRDIDGFILEHVLSRLFL
jgi:hypothetical protein